ncbi:hypothetical protein CR513_42980, partial [Mucuna pruriens]
MASVFENFTLVHVSRDQNERADLLAKLASTQRRGQQKSVIHESLSVPTKVIREAPKYTLVGQHLFRRGFAFPLLRCVEGEEATYVMCEVHEGICGTHIGGRALASKITRARYY